MTLSRGLRRTLIALATVALIVAAILVVTPIAAREIALHYLAREGVTATIDNVDVNLFTGHVAVDNAKGHTEGGDGFEIGHLAFSLLYPPLLSKRLSLSELVLSDAAVDIHRTADNALRVAGITVVSSEAKDNGSLDWGLGLQQLRVRDLRLHYSQPANGDQPAIDREITFNDSSARDMATWQTRENVPVQTDMAVGKSRLRLKGQITPFGQQVTGHFELETDNLALDLIAPFTRNSGLKHLTGTVDSQQQIDIRYDAADALSIALDGKAGWKKPELVQTGGLHASSDHLDWQGKVQLKLLRAGDHPGTIDTDGRIQIRGVDAGLDSDESGDFTLSGKTGTWQGKTTTVLAADATRIKTDGTLRTQGVKFAVPGAADFDSGQLNWQGTSQTFVAADTTRIDTDGSLKASGLNFAVPRTSRFSSEQLDWQGNAQTVIATNGTRVGTDGTLDTNNLTVDVPGAMTFNAEHMKWHGQSKIHSAGLFSRQAEGQLTATGARLNIHATPVALAAERLAFDGAYGEQPDASGKTLALTLSGDIDSHAFAVMNTAIDAPWLAMLQAHADALKIEGIDSIALAGLTAHGVRILGDTNTSASVISSVTTTARQFRLDDLSRYHLADLAIDGANIHVRRDDTGMGVIAQFFGGDDSDQQSTSEDAGPQAGPSYAIDHLALAGPAVAFTDVAVTPDVVLMGSDLNFAMDDLDTGNHGQSASYRLSLDVGAYGHLDSRGKIAPLAPGGIDMNLDAWLRSLALTPMSGYLNAAMGRQIANGVADGTLHLEATNGQLDGNLDTTLGNFRLANGEHAETTIALGISMDTALALVRGQNDAINFETAILGDVTNPYFSVKNLVREAVLAGLRTAITSDYSPLGLLNKAKNAVVNLGRSLASRPALFKPGKHYVRPEDRQYLGHLAQAMRDKPGLTLTVQGHAVPGDADAMSLFHGAQVDSSNRLELQDLARQRGEAVRDYLAARNVNPGRIKTVEPVVDRDKNAQPQATFSLGGR